MDADKLTLRQAFDLFNSRYFRGKLPKDTRVIWSDLTDINCLGVYDPQYSISARRVRGPKKGEYRICKARKHTIRICRRIKWSSSVWMRTLLHEMVHLKGIDGHGPRFQREMKRLAVRGGFAGLW